MASAFRRKRPGRFRLPVFRFGHPLQVPRFVDDPFEQPLNCLRTQRARVEPVDVREHFRFPRGLIDVHALFPFDASDLERARGARVEQADQMLVEHVDPAAQIVQVSPHDSPFSHRV